MKLLKPLLFVSAVVLLSFTTKHNTTQQWVLIGEKKGQLSY